MFTPEEVLSIYNVAFLQSVSEQLEDGFKGLPDDIRRTAVRAYADAAKTVGTKFAQRLAEPRGFEIAAGFESDGVHLPERSTTFSAGYDFRSLDKVIIAPNKSVKIRTGVKAFMPMSEVLMIYPRSSMGIKKGLGLANGVAIIDSDYYGNPSNDGHIILCIRNYGDTNQVIDIGDKIAQGIFTKFETCNDMPESTRVGGIGSTGK